MSRRKREDEERELARRGDQYLARFELAVEPVRLLTVELQALAALWKTPGSRSDVADEAHALREVEEQICEEDKHRKRAVMLAIAVLGFLPAEEVEARIFVGRVFELIAEAMPYGANQPDRARELGHITNRLQLGLEQRVLSRAERATIRKNGGRKDDAPAWPSWGTMSDRREAERERGNAARF